jgi:hypothetical protein
MKMERCKNGHLFNVKKYDLCPYCDEEILEEGGGENTTDQNPAAASSPGAKTVAYSDKQGGTSPVVGWLVCIEGAERGQDYKIISEKNFIGRSKEMHITINGDNAISRRNHAIISYNPKERNFTLIPGAETTGIVYVNEEAIHSPTEVTSYDVIEFGDSKFIFISLCGQHFELADEA